MNSSTRSPAAATKSLQSCPTLCDHIDGSPPGSPIPGVLQARTLEWVAISISNAWKWKAKVKLISPVGLLVTPWTAAYRPWDFLGKSTGVGCHCLLLGALGANIPNLFFFFLFSKIIFTYLALTGLRCSTQDLSLQRESSVLAAWALRCPLVCGVSVPWQRIEPVSPALEGGFFNPWTTMEAPQTISWRE